MYNRIISGVIMGFKSSLVHVEVDISQGLPCFVMVGSLGNEVKESAERVRIALKNINIYLPPSRITVNISPGDIKKTGTGFDFPIALGILVNIGIINSSKLDKYVVLGELALNGEIKKIDGVMPIVLEASRQGITQCLVPLSNADEASLVPGMKVIGVSSIPEIIEYLNSNEEEQDLIIPPTSNSQDISLKKDFKSLLDFSDVVGQETLKRGALIAASGFHNMLIIGPPGTGKSMVAKRLPSIMPPLTTSESMDVTAIYSIAGKLTEEEPFKITRPFISPHHTITVQGMAGGGIIPKPGAVSLAHKGILFLDELTEFKRQSIEILRQPLEEKVINLTRTGGSYSYPADIMLIAAMNPCPCGFFPDRQRCSCTPHSINLYLSHISGPILDRIDLGITAEKIDIKSLNQSSSSISSADLLSKVISARKLQEERFKGTSITFNSALDSSDILKYCHLTPDLTSYLEKVSKKLDLSARGYHRLLRISRTIADLDNSENIKKEHLDEGLGYRLILPKA